MRRKKSKRTQVTGDTRRRDGKRGAEDGSVGVPQFGRPLREEFGAPDADRRRQTCARGQRREAGSGGAAFGARRREQTKLADYLRSRGGQS